MGDDLMREHVSDYPTSWKWDFMAIGSDSAADSNKVRQSPTSVGRVARLFQDLINATQLVPRVIGNCREPRLQAAFNAVAANVPEHKRSGILGLYSSWREGAETAALQARHSRSEVTSPAETSTTWGTTWGLIDFLDVAFNTTNTSAFKPR